MIPQERQGDTEIKQQIRVNEVGYPSFCTLVSSLRRCMMDYYDGKRRNVNSALSIYTNGNGRQDRMWIQPARCLCDENRFVVGFSRDLLILSQSLFLFGVRSSICSSC